MSRTPHDELSRRERQIMDILYRLGQATAAEVQAEMRDEISYSTVRAQLRTLEDKGAIRHHEEGVRYVFTPAIPLDKARRSALRHLINTFYEGSAEQVVAALLDGSATKLTGEEIRRISALIDNARKEGR